jgi:hypothetical protein
MNHHIQNAGCPISRFYGEKHALSLSNEWGFSQPQAWPTRFKFVKATATRGEPGTRLNFRLVTIPAKTGNIKFSAP